jgi:2-polyprenyl-3-methyl-5-hydroxy-6-metoxy-1,4-benzoquinol methylase
METNMTASTCGSPAICEEDIRPAKLMVDKARCLNEDRQFLLDRRAEWVLVPCPACRGRESVPYGEKAGFDFAECCKCGTVYTNPRPSLALLHEFYAASQNYDFWNAHIFPATEAARRERIFRPRATRVAADCRRFGLAGGVLLEVGAAFGTFCEEVRALGTFDRIIALEPTPGLAATCRQRGFEVRECFVEQVEDTALADVVAAFEVIEHLFAPEDFIRSCQRLLRPGGMLVLTCPNVRGFDVATLRTLSGTFQHTHLNYFHPESLALLVERCGLAVLDVQTPGQLDADLVRKRVLAGEFDLSHSPLLKEVLIDRWDGLGQPFQAFLAANKLSSHLWIVAQKPAS